MKKIWDTFNANQFTTNIMAASFRNIGEILELGGIALMTVSPKFLDELASSEGELKYSMPSTILSKSPDVKENQFKEDLLKDKCANELLHQGISRFAEDAEKLNSLIDKILSNVN